MKPTDFISRLFEYDFWASNQIMNVLDENVDPEEMELLVHVGAAQEAWLGRLSGKSPVVLHEMKHCTHQELYDYLKKQHEDWKHYLAGLTESRLEEVFNYKDLRGNTHTSSLADVLHHIIIHGQHHRAQIASSLRKKGGSPPSTDFITFTRL